jgi:hypothetical protein
MSNKKIVIILLVFLVLLGLGLSKVLKNTIIDRFNTINEDKVAFLFLTRNNLKRYDIWDDFLKGNESRYSIYCHAKEPDKVKDRLLKENLIPEYIETCWGCLNLVEANIILMKNALEDPLNKKFILVSESCLPIVSFNTFYNTIMKDDKSRIGIIVNKTPERYNDIINPEFEEKNFFKHTGSGCIFNREHAQMLVDSLPKLKNWKTMIASDEHYNGNTLMVMDNHFKDNIISQSNTYDLWQKYDTNLDDNDIKFGDYILITNLSNKAIDVLRNKGYFFVRKVDENTQFDMNNLLNT